MPQLVRYFKAKEYNWSGLSEQQALSGKLKRAALQFTPYSFDDFDWRAFSTPVRTLESLGLIAIFLLMEVRRPASAAAHGLLAGQCGYKTLPNVPRCTLQKKYGVQKQRQLYD